MAIAEIGGAGVWLEPPACEPDQPFLYLRLLNASTPRRTPSYLVELAVGRTFADIVPADTSLSVYADQAYREIRPIVMPSAPNPRIELVTSDELQSPFSTRVLAGATNVLRTLGYEWTPNIETIRGKLACRVEDNSYIEVFLPDGFRKIRAAAFITASLRLARAEALRLHDIGLLR